MQALHVMILAAGNSTRLKSETNKILHPICGRPIIDSVLKTATSLKPQNVVLVLGKDRERILNHLKGRTALRFVEQKQRLGTAHAAQVALNSLKGVKGKILILSGDVPRVSVATIKQLQKSGKDLPLSLITAVLPNPFGYGRILRDRGGSIYGIVEEKNATPEQRQINEINAGIYLVDADFLRQALAKVKKDPIKKEFYLTDIIAQAVQSGHRVATHTVEDPHEIMGVNTRGELAYLQQIRLQELVGEHLQRGVGFQDPNRVYLEEGQKIAADTLIEAGVQMKGHTSIGPGCVLEAGCILINAKIGAQVRIRAYSYLENCEVKSNAIVGPFARLRPETVVSEEAHVGNFVELKKTRLGRGSKANHLSYLGDAIIGQKVNVGAGTITCNYDGQNKFRTVLGDGVFIGSDTQLVAPVKVGKNAYIGAGTTVTKNVPPDALALSRVEQLNIAGYAKKKRQSNKK